MTADSADPRGGAFSRARLNFRGWRRTRPFWGGLLLILSGAWMLLAANRDLGNLQVHLGMAGFQSYLIPIVLILCGALVWLTPAQRLFYGIIGTLVAIYSLVGANLGGFIVGFLLGTLGGGLCVAWVPNKHGVPAMAQASGADAIDDDADTDVQESQGLDVLGGDTAADETATGPLHDTLPTAMRSPLLVDEPGGAAGRVQDADVTVESGIVSGPTSAEAAEDEEGEQGPSFPGPRHAAGEPDVAGSDLHDSPEAPTGLASRLRKSPGGAVAIIAVLSMAAIALVTFRAPSAGYAAETCASPAYQSALEKLGVSGSPSVTAQPKTGTPKTGGSGTGSSNNGGSKIGGSATKKPGTGGSQTATVAPTPTPSPAQTGPIQGLIGTLGGLLPHADPSPTPTSTPSPSASPSAKPTPTAKPTIRPSPKPTKPGGPTTHPIAPRPKPASSTASNAPICATTKVFTDALNGVTATPSKMTTADLKMHNLAYKGVRPINGGKFNALWFTMDSSTSTPFELQPVVGDHTLDITSDELTVSGDVQFYCASMTGNLVTLGVPAPVKITFTPDTPPPVVLPEMEFTDVTIQLVYVHSETLTAKALKITSS